MLEALPKNLIARLSQVGSQGVQGFGGLLSLVLCLQEKRCEHNLQQQQNWRGRREEPSCLSAQGCGMEERVAPPYIGAGGAQVQRTWTLLMVMKSFSY